MDRNNKDDEGNTYIHSFLLKCDPGVKDIEFFLEHGTRLTRNFEGQSVLHFAARYSPFVLQVVDKLLEYKASVSEVDNQGSTVLHEILKNPFVTLEVIENLLEYGAHPDCCDKTGKPPLAYCESSKLQPDEKLLAEKLFIQYSIGKKVFQLNLKALENLDSILQLNLEELENLDESILCFYFVQDSTKLKLWTDIRNSCISEIKRMGIVHLEKQESVEELSVLALFSQKFNHILKGLSYTPISEDERNSLVKELRKNEYPNFRNMLIKELNKRSKMLVVDDS